MQEEDKARFVDELAGLLKRHSREKLQSLRYEQIGAYEVVIVTYKDGYSRNIDVTGDSVCAMLKDIGRALSTI